MTDRSRDIAAQLACLLVAIAAFVMMIGWQTLLPTNISWLNSGDRAMHTLGWLFYRSGPWTIPPGNSPDLGIERAGSIGLVDGLPLFAMPLKLFGPWLPQPFQYWGYWLLLCSCLQALFAFAIARELGAGRLASLVAAGFVLITPAFVDRTTLHMALSGHWTILAALYLYARREAPKGWMWPLLAGVTASIHVYLLVMVLAVWVAALVERLWTDRLTARGALTELFAVLVAALIVLWGAGLFGTGSLAAPGYGAYRLNLLWPLLTFGWSHLIPNWPHSRYESEGLSFLGVGVLALLALSLLTGAIAPLRAAAKRRWLPLTAVILLLMLFAFSDTIAFAGRQLFVIPLPAWTREVISVLRSTGRFVWPLLYVITIGAVVMIARRHGPAAALPLLLAAFGLQLWDSQSSLRSFAIHLPVPAATWTTPLGSPFWERAAAGGYDRVRAIPVETGGRDWRALGYYAVTHGMDTDSVRLGRANTAGAKIIHERDARALKTGGFEPRTLYELDMLSALNAAGVVGSNDLLATIDRRIILAMNGAHLVDGLGIDPHIGRASVAPGHWARLPWAQVADYCSPA